MLNAYQYFISWRTAAFVIDLTIIDTASSNFNSQLEWYFLEIGRCGFFEADTDISAIHGPIPIFPKFLNLVFCFIIKNMMYFMPYVFFKYLKNQDLWAKIFEIAAISIFD